MAELYLFDGYNLLHAGPFADARELVDPLASFVAVRGARGVVVFDGVGEDVTRGPLEVRFAAHADTLLERLAAEHRDRDKVVLVTSDSTVGWASGVEVAKLSSQTFLRDFEPAEHRDERPGGPRREARPGDPGLVGKAAPRRVSGSCAIGGCALCGSLLDSPQPQGETSAVAGRRSHLKNTQIPGVPPCPSAPHTRPSHLRRLNESLRICSSS